MIIRKLRPEEYDLLPEFLYEAIFVPEGEAPPPRDILQKPELRVYSEGFGAGGADAAHSTAKLVLLDSDFDALPAVVAEGRRSINNLQRSASLFLVKTIYATVLAVVFAILPLQFINEDIVCP